MTTDKSHKDFIKKLQEDPAKLKRFLRDILGPTTRRLEGQERDNIELMCTLAEPTHTSNNQRTITDVYHINQKEYHITYMLEDTPVIEEILPDDI
jgi:hypothetical protein